MIKLKKGLKVTTLQKVKIKDDDWNRPGGGYLNPGSVVIITSGPTRISDVPFKVLSGSGEVTHRNPTGETLVQIAPGPGRFFGIKPILRGRIGHPRELGRRIIKRVLERGARS